MTWLEKIEDGLSKTLTPKDLGIWNKVKANIQPVWDKSASSSMKFHRRKDGTVPTIAEHTYDMMFAWSKISRLCPSDMCASEVMLALALHDALKYGDPIQGHTVNDHDSQIANKLNSLGVAAKGTILDGMLRYHSGKWSSEAEAGFCWVEKAPEILIVHMLDMLSTADVLKI